MNTVPKTALSPVDFHGQTLFLVEHNGQPFTPMKPIVEGMGLDWAGQFTKLKDKADRFCIGIIPIQMPGDDQTREVLFMPLRKLPAWLLGVNPKKVRPSIRKKVIMYQRECDDALWDYWTKGQAVNPRAAAALPSPETEPEPAPAPAPQPQVVGFVPVEANITLEPVYVGEEQSTRFDRKEITDRVGDIVDVLNTYGWAARNSSVYKLISGRFGLESIKYLAKKDVPLVKQYLDDLMVFITGWPADADDPALPAPSQAPAIPAAALAPVPTMPVPAVPEADAMAGMTDRERSQYVIEAQLAALDKLYYAVDDYLYAAKRVISAEVDKLTKGAPAGERMGRKAIAAELRSSYGQHTHAMLASVNAIRSILRVTATAAGMILSAKGRAKPTRAKRPRSAQCLTPKPWPRRRPYDRS